MGTSFYTEEELKGLGLKSYGRNVLISRKCSIYGAGNIAIGNNVRIDDFVILSVGTELVIGDYVHIACYSSIIGNGKVHIGNYCGLSGRVSVYSSTDDYMGFAMTNPMVPDKYTAVYSADVSIMAHSLIGCGSVILPGVTIEKGVSVAALSLVDKRCKTNNLYGGNPCQKLCAKSTDYLKMAEDFERSLLTKSNEYQ